METQTTIMSPEKVKEEIARKAEPVISLLEQFVGKRLSKTNIGSPTTIDLYKAVTGEYGLALRMAPHPKFCDPSNVYAVEETIRRYAEAGWEIEDLGCRTFIFRYPGRSK